eukprot:jgi/Chlat1/5388/Chrsp35S05304
MQGGGLGGGGVRKDAASTATEALSKLNLDVGVADVKSPTLHRSPVQHAEASTLRSPAMVHSTSSSSTRFRVYTHTHVWTISPYSELLKAQQPLLSKGEVWDDFMDEHGHRWKLSISFLSSCRSGGIFSSTISRDRSTWRLAHIQLHSHAEAAKYLVHYNVTLRLPDGSSYLSEAAFSQAASKLPPKHFDSRSVCGFLVELSSLVQCNPNALHARDELTVKVDMTVLYPTRDISRG